MSPRIVKETYACAKTLEARLAGGREGVICATGWPKRCNKDRLPGFLDLFKNGQASGLEFRGWAISSMTNTP